MLRLGQIVRGVEGVVARQVKQIDDGLQRIVDLVRDRSGEASRGGELFAAAHGFLGLLLRGNVARDGRCAHDFATRVSQRRHRQQRWPAGAVLAHALGAIGSHVSAAVEYLEVTVHLGLAFRRRQSRYGQSDGFLGRVAIELFGGAIPTGDEAGRTGAVNCVSGVFHDGRHLTGGALGARFRQRFLPGHASGKNGNGEENRQPLGVGAGADPEV